MITVTIYETLSECASSTDCTGCIGVKYPEKCWYPGKRKSLEA